MCDLLVAISATRTIQSRNSSNYRMFAIPLCVIYVIRTYFYWLIVLFNFHSEILLLLDMTACCLTTFNKYIQCYVTCDLALQQLEGWRVPDIKLTLLLPNSHCSNYSTYFMTAIWHISWVYTVSYCLARDLMFVELLHWKNSQISTYMLTLWRLFSRIL